MSRQLLSSLILLIFTCISNLHASAISQDRDSIPLSDDIITSNSTPQDLSSKDYSHREKPKEAPPVVHPSIDTLVRFGGNKQIRLAHKIQNYKGGPTRDADVLSPKSVNIHPSGKKFYVNSLEGGKTMVYSLPGLKKIAVINHRFNSSHSRLWAPSSGLFKFRHYTEGLNNFTGKPVESTFSHDGRYLWVPYYRRSYDINAQDPSALAVIDTSTDTIVRIMEAGVLPKMIATSPDGGTIAIAHWGDNTVGLIDISSADPKQWKYKANVAVGRQLFHDFSLTESVDRDKNSGEALRGTVFTPDGKYLLVGCMSGGGIAVIDVEKRKYLGKLFGMMANVRHVVIKGDWLYTSVNIAGYVQRIKISEIQKAIENMGNSRNISTSGWETVKVRPGARTLELSPAGDYIFVACNFGSMICIVDSTMKNIAEIPVDSYPVGLDISPDGKWLISTSQGRNRFGGNCVDIFALSGLKAPDKNQDKTKVSSETDQGETIVGSIKGLYRYKETFDALWAFIAKSWIPIIINIVVVVLIIFIARRLLKK